MLTTFLLRVKQALTLPYAKALQVHLRHVQTELLEAEDIAEDYAALIEKLRKKRLRLLQEIEIEKRSDSEHQWLPPEQFAKELRNGD